MSAVGAANYQVNPAISAPVHAAGRSFLAGFVVNILVAGMNNGTSVVAGVTGGVLSAAATLIDFALRPLITALFGSNRDNAFFIGLSCNVIIYTILIAATAAAAPTLGMTVGVNIVASACARIALSLLTGFGPSSVIVVR